MAILTPTELTGRVVFLGRVPDRAAGPASVPADELAFGFEGVAGESHAGLTPPSCSRVTGQYPKGTEIRNTRQVSILSTEELAETARLLGIPALPPEWVGASMVLEGIPDFTLVPPSSRLVFEGGASLTVDMENAPCQIPAREIETRHPGVGRGYKAAARNRRGVTAWVEREGVVRLGETVRLHVPPVRLYPPLAAGAGEGPG